MSHMYKVGDQLKKVRTNGGPVVLTIAETLMVRGRPMYKVTSSRHSATASPYYKDPSILEDTSAYVLIQQSASANAIIWPMNSQVVTKIHPFHKAQIIDYVRNGVTGDIVGYDILRNTGARESHTIAKLHAFWDLMITQSQMTSPAQMMAYGRFGGGFKEEAAEEWNVTTFASITKMSLCDCGGHKLGYSDDQLHGHGTWCKLVENASATLLLKHGD